MFILPHILKRSIRQQQNVHFNETPTSFRYVLVWVENATRQGALSLQSVDYFPVCRLLTVLFLVSTKSVVGSLWVKA